MYKCRKCNEIIDNVISKRCPHCFLPLFNEAFTTWIGSSSECNIIIKREDIAPFVAAIYYNPDNKTHRIYNLNESFVDLSVNRKIVSYKETVSIADWMKIKNIILDFNHPKISPLFNLDVKINIKIDFENLEEFTIGNAENSFIKLEELSNKENYAIIIKSKSNYFCSYPTTKTVFLPAHPPIFINEFKLSHGDLKLIDENDSIFIEDIKLDLSLIPSFLNVKDTFYVTEKFPLEFVFDGFQKNSISIGQSNCDIVLISEKVSYKHIQLKKISDEKFWIEDCDSYFGTYLDNIKIKETEISLDQPIIFGDFKLKLIERDNNIIVSIEHLKGKIKLDTLNLSKYVKDYKFPFTWINHHLLRNISLSIRAGELVALMGPSGAGKSTLLKMLAGVDKINGKSIKGKILFNEIDITANPKYFKYSIGYLPQDDILFPDLTVYECLLYVAKLRLPKLTKNNIDSVIDNVLISLDLAIKKEDGTYDFPLKTKRIGDINKSGALSGGQRKRVNLAVELLSNPSILFLDEPTSGLSSTDSEKLINLLVKICNVGNTVITTIHQPSEKIFSKFNKILILTKRGSIAYFGSVQRSVDFFERKSNLKYDSKDNPADYILEALETKPPEYWEQQYLESESYEFYVKHPHHKFKDSHKIKRQNKGVPVKEKILNVSQISSLVSRNFKLKWNNKVSFLLLLFQAPLIALFLGLIFSGVIHDGSLLSDMKPEEEFIRMENYSRPSTMKYLPPFSKDIKIVNSTSKPFWVYSQSNNIENIDTNYYVQIGPYIVSKQEVYQDDEIYFPVKAGNYKLIVSEDPLGKEQLSNSFRFSEDLKSNSYYYLLNYPKKNIAVNDWGSINDSQKVKLWSDKILIDRKRKAEENDELFKDYKIFNKNNTLAFLNSPFNNIYFFNQIKKYYFTIENNKYSWFDSSHPKKIIYTGSNGYKEQSQKLLYLTFIMILSFIWIGMTNSVKDVVIERQIFLREHRYTLKIYNYVTSKFLTLIVISTFQIITFLLVLFLFIPPLPADIWTIFLILLLTALVSGGIGLIISSLASTIEFAIFTLPLILIPQIIFAGIFKHIGAMNDFLRYISDLTVSRWSLESMVNLISKSVDFESPFHNMIVPFNNIIYPCYYPTFENGQLIQHGYFPYVLEIDILLLIGFSLATYVISSLVLFVKTKYFRR